MDEATFNALASMLQQEIYSPTRPRFLQIAKPPMANLSSHHSTAISNSSFVPSVPVSEVVSPLESHSVQVSPVPNYSLATTLSERPTTTTVVSRNDRGPSPGKAFTGNTRQELEGSATTQPNYNSSDNYHNTNNIANANNTNNNTNNASNTNNTNPANATNTTNNYNNNNNNNKNSSTNIQAPPKLITTPINQAPHWSILNRFSVSISSLYRNHTTSITVTDNNLRTLRLCPSTKHIPSVNKVRRVSRSPFSVALREAEGLWPVTIYCKGTEFGGCTTKRPAPVRVVVKLEGEGGEVLVFVSQTIYMRARRTKESDDALQMVVLVGSDSCPAPKLNIKTLQVTTEITENVPMDIFKEDSNTDGETIRPRTRRVTRGRSEDDDNYNSNNSGNSKSNNNKTSNNNNNKNLRASGSENIRASNNETGDKSYTFNNSNHNTNNTDNTNNTNTNNIEYDTTHKTNQRLSEIPAIHSLPSSYPPPTYIPSSMNFLKSSTSSSFFLRNSAPTSTISNNMNDIPSPEPKPEKEDHQPATDQANHKLHSDSTICASCGFNTCTCSTSLPGLKKRKLESFPSSGSYFFNPQKQKLQHHMQPHQLPPRQPQAQQHQQQQQPQPQPSYVLDPQQTLILYKLAEEKYSQPPVQINPIKQVFSPEQANTYLPSYSQLTKQSQLLQQPPLPEQASQFVLPPIINQYPRDHNTKDQYSFPIEDNKDDKTITTNATTTTNAPVNTETDFSPPLSTERNVDRPLPAIPLDDLYQPVHRLGIETP